MEATNLAFVISYTDPNYIRGYTLYNALQKCPSLNVYRARNTRKGFVRYLQTIVKVILIHIKYRPHIWLLNFRGHEIYWFLRMVVGKNKQIIFDEFVSPYDSLVNERKFVGPDSILAKLIYLIEKSILNNANVILTDTQSQANYYSTLFNIPVRKIFPVNMSVNEELFNDIGPKKNYGVTETFVVFTYATFLPLHGMEVVLEATRQLRDLPIHFYVAGGKGKNLRLFLRNVEMSGASNIKHIKWIEFEELPTYIRGADICLGGPFGNTGQGKRVITGKTLQFIACARPTIIGQGYETDNFRNRDNCLLVPQGDGRQLAIALRWAFEHQFELQSIADQGRILYMEKYSSASVRESTKLLINKVHESAFHPSREPNNP